ncbi:EUTSA_v10026581mg [Fagus crenata]
MIRSGWSKSDERKRGNEMAVTEKSFIFNNLSFLTSYPFAKTNGRKFGITLAKKRDLSENSSSQQENIFPLRVSNPILARSVVAVLGLGFIDSGYSGDWSRIGVISKEAEGLLKFAAFIVVPLCIFLIFSISKEPEV